MGQAGKEETRREVESIPLEKEGKGKKDTRGGRRETEKGQAEAKKVERSSFVVMLLLWLVFPPE